MSDKNDWEFKVEIKNHGKDETVTKAQAKKRRLTARQAIKKKSPKLKLEAGKTGTRLTRTQLAQKTKTMTLAEMRPEKAKTPHTKRLIAFTIDLLVEAVLVTVLMMLYRNKLQGMVDLVVTKAAELDVVIASRDIRLFYCVLLVHFIFIFFPTSSTGRTIGKYLCGLRVEKSSGKGIGFLSSFFREFFFKPISVLSGIGLLLAVTNKRHRCLHDFLSGSVVKI